MFAGNLMAAHGGKEEKSSQIQLNNAGWWNIKRVF